MLLGMVSILDGARGIGQQQNLSSQNCSLSSPSEGLIFLYQIFSTENFLLYHIPKDDGIFKKWGSHGCYSRYQRPTRCGSAYCLDRRELVPLKKASVSRLQKAIRRVLMEDSYKKQALRLQEAIERAGGVKRAADIIEKGVSTGEPVVD